MISYHAKIILDPPSWISKLFSNVRKSPNLIWKNRKKYIKRFWKKLFVKSGNLMKMKIKLKTPNLGKTACQNSVAMETSSHVIKKLTHQAKFGQVYLSASPGYDLTNMDVAWDQAPRENREVRRAKRNMDVAEFSFLFSFYHHVL